MILLAGSVAPAPDWRLGVVLVLLVALAVGVSLLARTGVAREQLVAAVRAVVQLAAVSLVIAAALSSVWWSLLVVLGMYAVAVATATRRVDVPARQAGWVGLAVAAGALPVLVLSLGSGVVPFSGAGIVPVAGIVVGGTMTAATLTGRRTSDELAQQHGRYEAALALGLPQHEAAFLVVEPSAREALVPGIDQTRTVGLVTLPGAFIGVLLGGGTPLEAASAQVLVLVGLMAGQAVTNAVMLRLMTRARIVRRDLAGVFPR
ncbi:ABC transporter permease [Nocardioides aurantiacus]|uniref:Putative ABC transport system permease protein n=1 Tax=Nocardioides aurantiacus TaxID=86796 RepID=A0A3N2CXP9_9ACTN|nr:ABC transporter permease [Nocardioides aurantiacus]ROR92279.1 putative ABC transport system permease protein [Nocardioides aurantiacus]